MREYETTNIDDLIEKIKAADLIDLDWIAERNTNTTKDGDDEDVTVIEYKLNLRGVW
jgi:hypothetical protein